MNLSNAEIFCGGTFKFLIGASMEYTVHKALIFQISEPLAKLITNGMAESEEGCARLCDVDEETFSRFVEWIYTKVYSSSRPIEEKNVPGTHAEDICSSEVPIEDGPGPGPESHCSDDDNFAFKASRKRTKKLQKKARRIAEEDEMMQEDSRRDSSPTIVGRFQIYHDDESDQGLSAEYAERFLIHARLYVFADQYGIKELMHLAATRLESSLSDFGHFYHRAVDVVQVARYVFENTPSRLEYQDELRHVVVHSITMNFEELMQSEEMGGLMNEGGDLVNAVCSKVAQRISHLRKQHSINLWGR